MCVNYKKLVLSVMVQGALMASEEGFTPYQEALLLEENGKALSAEKLEPNTAYFFQYPYNATPAVLVKNEERDENNATRYRLYAYLAINPVTFASVNNDVSVLSFYKGDVFGNDVLRFCDDKSSYSIFTGKNVRDSNGSRYLSLSRVHLKEEEGKIYATGVSDIAPMSGMFKEKYDALVKRFRSMWYAKIKYNKPKVLRHDRFSIVSVKCNDILPQMQENNRSVDNDSSGILEN
jgi:hypothetical protein